MKSFISACVLLVLLVSAAFASGNPTIKNTPAGGSTTGRTPSGPVVVNAPGQGSQNGITVTNGNYNDDFPAFIGSVGTARLKKQVSSPDHTDVTCDNGFKGSITGLEVGDTVDLRVNSYALISGAGGSVTIAGGSSVVVTNTAPAGGANLMVHVGGTDITVTPGTSVPITTH
jgi:hypothetical protein